MCFNSLQGVKNFHYSSSPGIKYFQEQDSAVSHYCFACPLLSWNVVSSCLGFECFHLTDFVFFTDRVGVKGCMTKAHKVLEILKKFPLQISNLEVVIFRLFSFTLKHNSLS